MSAFLNLHARVRPSLARVLAALVVGGALAGLGGEPAATVRFNRDIRPILSENCFVCHGPDKSSRKVALRLDTPEGAYAQRSNGVPVVPGKPETSLLLQRVTATDPDGLMPPPQTGKKLSARQIDLLRRWLAEGARFEGHWAYEPPVRGPLLDVRQTRWVRNPIDRFILARLEQVGLEPSPEADRRTLIRRLSFDLTGLPPDPKEAEDFVQSTDSQAYEKAVQRFLGSVRFGERMAVPWLDLVRYADTVGFHGDNPISVWPYRDYVIRAFNENVPFDRFTREQLAGDLLPDAGRWPKVASAYNRLNRMSTEGGVQDKEYRAKYAADRVRTTATVWLGATMACAECHDHKFDPYLTKDFYRFAAFFADLKEQGFYDGGFARGDWGPSLSLPTSEQEQSLTRLDTAIAALKKELGQTADTRLQDGRQRWEAALLAADKQDKLGWKSQRIRSAVSAHGATLSIQKDEVVQAHGFNPDTDIYILTLVAEPGEFTGLRLETLTDEDLPGNRMSRGGVTFLLTGLEVAAETAGLSQRPRLVEASATVNDPGYPVQAVFDDRPETGWGVRHGHSSDLKAAFVFDQPLRCASNTVLTVRLRQESSVRRATLGKFKLALATVVHPTHEEKGLPEDVLKALREPADKRTDPHNQRLAVYYRQVASELASPRRRLAALEAERSLVQAAVATVLVSERTDPRPMRVLPRGNWMDETGEVVEPGVPSFLRPIKVENRRATRLELAEWLVSSDNPLTARAVMNRWWKMLFGTGLSRTLDDLGSQGEWPSHLELLDWLAVEFRESGWNTKHMIELLVTSAAYRQASLSQPALDERDPQNRLLARQNRTRLDAEFVRDNALAVAGLLVERVGGPSVFPYQPEGYWAPLNFPKREYVLDRGENLHRRGLYMHWQRSFLHPSLVAFDAPPREECTANRPVSNTPMQALVLLNDPNYVEAARALAGKILEQSGPQFERRLDWAYRRALARPASADETRLLAVLHQQQWERFRGDSTAAQALVSTGSAPTEPGLDLAELAAWTSVARTILNLHETNTRN